MFHSSNFHSKFGPQAVLLARDCPQHSKSKSNTQLFALGVGISRLKPRLLGCPYFEFGAFFLVISTGFEIWIKGECHPIHDEFDELMEPHFVHVVWDNEWFGSAQCRLYLVPKKSRQ